MVWTRMLLSSSLGVLGVWGIAACQPTATAPKATSPAVVAASPQATQPPAKPTPSAGAQKSGTQKPGAKPSATAATAVKPTASTAPKGPPPESYSRALDKADSARNITLTARSQDDWNLVASQWQQAVQLMKSVPKANPYYARAQAQAGDYQRQMASAQTKASRTNATGDNLVDSRLGADPLKSQGQIATEMAAIEANKGRVFQVPIKRRAGGTPVIDVLFNGSQSFEMIVDTGASGTVITPQMASSLGVSVVGQAKVNTASDRGVTVALAQVSSIAVGAAMVKDVTVAIGGDALEIGLLGHDFFVNYEVTIKRDVVEFRAH
jgi:predicted aspartyl protease